MTPYDVGGTPFIKENMQFVFDPAAFDPTQDDALSKDADYVHRQSLKRKRYTSNAW